MPPRWKGAIEWLGLVDDRHYEEKLKADQVPPAPETGPGPEVAPSAQPGEVENPPAPAAESFVPAARPLSQPDEFGGDDTGLTVALVGSLLVTPRHYSEIKPVADNYIDGRATVLNLRVMSHNDAAACADFFHGMVYALGGSCKEVDDHVLLLTPPGAVVDQTVLSVALAEAR